MADSDQALLEAEEMRNRFVGRVRGDLANLYRVYCRIAEFAQATGDAELKAAAYDLLKVWDDLSDTAAVKVIANGFVDWALTRCGPTPDEAQDGVERLMDDAALRSNLSDEEWKTALEIGRKWLEVGTAYEDVRRGMVAVNHVMGTEWATRDEMLNAVLAALSIP